ncbi:MAG: permease, partial [Alphaproteobacteria bacterium]|nr:permease [Alphaproteobacteria bacterium]
MTALVLRRIGDLSGAVDRVWLAVAAILLAVAALDAAQAAESVRFALAALLHVAPFLVFSVLVAAGAAATGADNLIARAFTGRLPLMIA